VQYRGLLNFLPTANWNVSPLLKGIERLSVLGRRPALPVDLRIYVVGDIHGRLDLLDKLLAQIQSDSRARPIARPISLFLGDYIDRGPSSRETIDRLIEHRERSECVFLMGNHEQIAIKCLTDPRLVDRWMRLGGMETLISYGVLAAVRNPATAKQIAELQTAFHNALPQAHFRFLRDLRKSFSCGDFFFVHAGVRPGVNLTQQTENDLLWIREAFLSSREDFGKIVVHGHTPRYEIEVEPNRINIDTGAFATGCLSCLVIEGESLSVIETRA
jgi:serine/threonine protein phosphatase 1